jgi:molybdopterin-containing oxidoreductase family iron-sulfur binding subunit
MNKNDTKAHKFGMVIDLDKCTGCGSCMVSCMSENNVPFKEDESNKKDSITWMRVYKLTNGKSTLKESFCQGGKGTFHAFRCLATIMDIQEL